MILWDADKLSKIGLTAAIHWTGMTLSEKESVTTSELIALGRAANWQSKTVDSMHTLPARRASRERKRSFERFWDQLVSELKGDDLH